MVCPSCSRLIPRRGNVESFGSDRTRSSTSPNGSPDAHPNGTAAYSVEAPHRRTRTAFLSTPSYSIYGTQDSIRKLKGGFIRVDPPSFLACGLLLRTSFQALHLANLLHFLLRHRN